MLLMIFFSDKRYVLKLYYLYSLNMKATLSITLSASTGFKTTMAIEKTKTVEDMLKEYVNKIDLSEDTIGNDILFLYNGFQLDPKSKSKVETEFKDNSTIIVFDKRNLIPYWTIKFDTSTGVKTEIGVNKTKTIKDMMEVYANKIGFPKEAIGKEIKFLYNGANLDAKANDPVESVLEDFSSVIVFDQNNLIPKYSSKSN